MFIQGVSFQQHLLSKNMSKCLRQSELIFLITRLVFSRFYFESNIMRVADHCLLFYLYSTQCPQLSILQRITAISLPFILNYLFYLFDGDSVELLQLQQSQLTANLHLWSLDRPNKEEINSSNKNIINTFENNLKNFIYILLNPWST